MKTRIEFSLFLFVSMTCAPSCKQRSSSSDQQSLDAYSSGSEATICKNETSDVNAAPFYAKLFTKDPQQPKRGLIVADSGYLKRLKPILDGIPLGLLQWYFEAGGNVYLTSNVEDNQTCNAPGLKNILPLYDAESRFAGCLATLPSGSQIPQIFVLVSRESITREAQDKQLSMLTQAFAKLTSFFVSRVENVYTSSTGTTTLTLNGQSTNEVGKQKTELGFFFWEDLQNNAPNIQDDKTKKTISALLQMIDANEQKSSTSRRNQFGFYLSKASQAKGQTYIDVVFANILESAWCNDSSRAVLSKLEGAFPQIAKRWSVTGFGQKFSATLAGIEADTTSKNNAEVFTTLRNVLTNSKILNPENLQPLAVKSSTGNKIDENAGLPERLGMGFLNILAQSLGSLRM